MENLLKRPNKSVFFVFIGLALDGSTLFCYYVGMTYEAPRHKAMKNPINAWGAERPKYREFERPLWLQHLRQERQTHQWRIHRPGGGQALDGGAGEESRVNIGIHWKLAPFLERKGAGPKNFT